MSSYQIHDPALDFLSSIVIRASVMRFNSYCRINTLRSKEIEDLSQIEKAEKLSMILLWSSFGTLILTTKFNLVQARRFAADSLQRSAEEISDEISVDFVKEFSNMQAGFLRGVFESCGIRIGMSLPFILAGENELIFDKLRGSGRLPVYFKLTDDIESLQLSLEVLSLNSSYLLKLKNKIELKMQEEEKSSEQITSGEVNFF